MDAMHPRGIAVVQSEPGMPPTEAGSRAGVSAKSSVQGQTV